MPNVGICFVRSPAEVSSEFVVRTARKTEETGVHSFSINDRITGDYLEPLRLPQLLHPSLKDKNRDFNSTRRATVSRPFS